MSSIRITAIILIAWLFFVFNIERSIFLVDIRSYTYIFVALNASLTLLITSKGWTWFWVQNVIFCAGFILLKIFWHDEPILGEATTLTVTQICVIILTGLFARQFNHHLIDFSHSIDELTYQFVGNPPEVFAESQGPMYTEVKRSRRYERPVTMLALRYEGVDLKPAANQLILKIQKEMAEQYLLANLSQQITQNTQDFDLIALYDRYFLVLLPETTKTQAIKVGQHLQESIHSQFGVELPIGLATYPDDVFTFEGMVAKALNNANERHFLSGGEEERTDVEGAGKMAQAG